MGWELALKSAVARGYETGKTGSKGDDFEAVALVTWIDAGVVQIEGALTRSQRRDRDEFYDLMRLLHDRFDVHTIEVKRARNHRMPYGEKHREENGFSYYRVNVGDLLNRKRTRAAA